MCAELAGTGGLREQLLRALDRQLVGRELLGHARALPVPLEVRPVAADAEDDPVPDLERVDLARVDGAQVRHKLMQAEAGNGGGGAADAPPGRRAPSRRARAPAEPAARQP